MSPLQDLPVCVDLPGVLGQEVTAWVEDSAGWQVVAAQGPPQPALTLASAVRRGIATVVVLDGEPPAAQVRAALLDGALDVVGWPVDRPRLLEAPQRLRPHAAPAAAPALLRVAGAAGGTGTSTMALALGGLLAWADRRVVVVGDDAMLALCGLPPWQGPAAADLAALRAASDIAAESAALPRPVPGVAGLAVLGGDGAAVTDVRGWRADAVVADLGARPPEAADLIVARADASLRAAVALGAAASPRADQAGRVVVIGDRPLGRAGVTRVLGRAPDAWVPWSARVARAGVTGTVPAGLPGAWLRPLRSLLAGGRR